MKGVCTPLKMCHPRDAAEVQALVIATGNSAHDGFIGFGLSVLLASLHFSIEAVIPAPPPVL